MHIKEYTPNYVESLDDSSELKNIARNFYLSFKPTISIENIKALILKFINQKDEIKYKKLVEESFDIKLIKEIADIYNIEYKEKEKILDLKKLIIEKLNFIKKINNCEKKSELKSIAQELGVQLSDSPNINLLKNEVLDFYNLSETNKHIANATKLIRVRITSNDPREASNRTSSIICVANSIIPNKIARSFFLDKPMHIEQFLLDVIRGVYFTQNVVNETLTPGMPPTHVPKIKRIKKYNIEILEPLTSHDLKELKNKAERLEHNSKED